jgi:hypothetical protein
VRDLGANEVRQSATLSTAGRILAVTVLVLGPLFWCLGLLLRTLAVSSAGFTPEEIARHAAEQFAAREQLAAYAANPALTVAGYATFLIGAILLIPATAALACLAARRSPWPAILGGVLVIFGLVARVYFAGVEQTAFQLVDTQGVDAAATTVGITYVDISYGPWRVPVTAAFGQYLGMPLLAAGLYRARIFGGVRVLVLLWSATMWGGVLKAAGWWDVVSSFLLFVVLAALAVQLGRDGEPRLRHRRGLLSW